jgi:short-subunit dehydrogenase
MQETMKKQGKQMAIRDTKIEILKNDLQQKTKELKDAVKLLRKSFAQIEKVVNSARLSHSKGQLR